MVEIYGEEGLYSESAERCVLGSVLLLSTIGQQTRALGRIKSSYFVKTAHQLIFAAMVRVNGKRREIDTLTLRDDLVSTGNLGAIGGEDYLLQCAQYVPSASNLLAYIETIEEKAARRAIIARCEHVAKMALTEPIDDIREKVGQIGKGVGATHIPLRGIAESDLAVPDKGVPTGYPTIDGYLSTGGYPAAQTSVVAAYTKGGKSAWLVGSAVAAATAEKRTVYATFADLNRGQLSRRIMRHATGFGSMPHSAHHAQVWSSILFDFTNEITPLYVYDASEHGDYTIEKFRDWVTEQHAKAPFDLVILDYGQRIKTSQPKLSTYDRDSFVAWSVDALARELRIPVVVGSQITEGGKDRKDTTKGTRDWEENAGLTIRLSEDPDAPVARRNVEIALNRFGRSRVRMNWEWDEERLRFKDPAAAAPVG